MAALQEVLAVLLGAESEARSEIEEARNEAERSVRKAKDAFSQERERRLAGAREQAKSLLEMARTAADTESGQILKMGTQELDRMRERFDENIRDLVEALAAEVAESCCRKARMPSGGGEVPPLDGALKKN